MKVSRRTRYRAHRRKFLPLFEWRFGHITKEQVDWIGSWLMSFGNVKRQNEPRKEQ